MVSNQCYILPHCQSISHTSSLACSILFFSGPPANAATPPPFICWAASCEQLVSMRRASVWEVLHSPGSLVQWGGMWKRCSAGKAVFSFFFVVLAVIMCSHMFSTAANEIVSKIKSGKAVNGQVNFCRAKIFIFTVANTAEEVFVWSQKQTC